MPNISGSRKVILDAIDRVKRYGLPMTPEKVRANIAYGSLTMDDASDALRKHINAQIPLVMKEQGLVIVDVKTRERKSFWDATTDELEEQIAVKRRSSDFDANRLAADSAVLIFLREKEKEYGYAVYPGLFKADITRIYSMHGITSARVAA